ncbi:uncharacterized protein LOC143368942 isoform X2 [Andrena cerasifolii]|uniref:uncharacterized protein LOC143368942 isoform X2 n=1 Tax=Andrena cerasifolii TaxID=2819439 RepID=UPI00403834B7
MIMHKGYIVIAIYIVHVRSVISNLDECNYFCDADGCQTSNSNNVSTLDFLEFCGNEDIPNVNIIPITYQDGTNFPGDIEINLIPPKGACKYEITLFANESVNEKACISYDFENIDTELHTTNTICFVSNNNEHRRSIRIPFRYIFTACYAVQIYFGRGGFVKSNRFFTTNYSRTEVVKPKLKCVYNILPNNTKEHNELYFEIDFSTSIVENAILWLRTMYTYEGHEECNFNSDNISNNSWSFNVLITSGVYERKLNFTIESLRNTKYCVVIVLLDPRCVSRSLWKSPMNRNGLCEWFKECQYIPTHFGIKVDNNANFYLFLSIVIIMLSMLSMLVIVYFICMIYTCNIQKVKLYISPSKRNAKTNQHKYSKMVMRALKDTENLFCDNISNTGTDIVLLYPKSSESFMTLMADFRGILGTVCQCLIHDWYDGIQWNHVAEIGGSDWFAEMLNRGARVIWIDTRTTRSLIKRRFKRDFSVKSSDQHNYVEIADFRDIVFPIIFTLAKRNVDASMIQRHKHFIVRLKGFDNFENEDDPFGDLSSHKRYLIPLDLSSLCSDLSIMNLNVITPIMSKEEDLIKQHLYRVERDFHE